MGAWFIHPADRRPGLLSCLSKPKLTEIYYRVIPDAASRSVALETGEAQMAQWGDVETFDVERLAALPHLNLTTSGYEFYSPVLWYELNLRKAPFNDLRFRKAMMHLLDKQFIVDRIMFGLAKAATGPIASTTKFYDDDVASYEFSAEKATALLDEMGMVPDASGTRATIRFLVAPYGEVWSRLAEYFRQAMAAGGIEVILDSTDVARLGKEHSRLGLRCIDEPVVSVRRSGLGVARSYVSSNIRKGVLFSNTEGYENPEVDRLFAEAATKTKDAERQELYSQVQKILVDELPVLWMAEQRYPTLHDSQLKDVITSAIGVNANFKDAYFA